MLNNPSDSPKRRPVDALFGDEDNSTAIPNYIVEAPHPPSNIAPPPLGPEDEGPSHQVPSPADSEAVSEPIEEESPPPVIITPSPPSAPSAEEDPRFITLSFQIERLYDEVKIHLRDSPKATQECFDLLLQARQAYVRRDFPGAEFFVQSTDAKLKRSVESEEESHSVPMILLWLWQLGALVVAVLLIAITYIANLTLFGLPVAAELLVFLRALGWGMIGGVVGGMYNMTRYLQRREYDPAYTMHYFARPMVGSLIGATLFVLSQAGILAGNLIVGEFSVGPVFLYVFALLAGFKQEFIGDFLDKLTQVIFRRETQE
jgi:hypothetical protein